LVVILLFPIRKYPTDFNNLNSIANKVNVSLYVITWRYRNVSRLFGINGKKKSH